MIRSFAAACLLILAAPALAQPPKAPIAGLTFEWRVEPTGHGRGPAQPSSPVVAVGQTVDLLAVITAAPPGQELVFRAYAPAGNLNSLSLQGDLNYACSDDAKKSYPFGGAGVNWYAKGKAEGASTLNAASLFQRAQKYCASRRAKVSKITGTVLGRAARTTDEVGGGISSKLVIQ